jgi:hypothetical protein
VGSEQWWWFDRDLSGAGAKNGRVVTCPSEYGDRSREEEVVGYDDDGWEKGEE